MWEALADVSEREGQSIHSIATEIDRRRGNTAMTSAVRVFVLGYYQTLARNLENRLESGGPTPDGGQSRPKGSCGAVRILDDVFGAR